MDPAELLVPLDGSRPLELDLVGGKAARLNQLAAAGLTVPRGFCLTTAAYRSFVEAHDLEPVLRMELGRKPLATMRWEEMWDAALRVRSTFLARDLPAAVGAALERVVAMLGADQPLAVRSSAPREDAAQASFAGLHESVVDVRGAAAVRDAVRVVWASLWSDAVLLYLAELGLDPASSRMAVVIQEQVGADRSGVAFGVDPREREAGRQLIEAVPGPCSELVDGALDPDRWVLDRSSGAVLSWRAGDRGEAHPGQALLGAQDLGRLHAVLCEVEQLCGWPPDIEWNGRGAQLHLLQARPVTGAAREDADERRWYLGLRPGLRRLRELRRTVVEERIPELTAAGERLAAEDLLVLDDRALADALEERWAALLHWREIYRTDLIPLAHGVRALGTYYNDAVRPADPFEFVGLVRGEELRALLRNRELTELSAQLRASVPLTAALERALAHPPTPPPTHLDALEQVDGGPQFLAAFERVRAEHFDVEYAGERWCQRPEVLLRHVLELARSAGPAGEAEPPRREELEQRLLEAVGSARAEEAAEMLAVGRVSWRLRDDDNLLLGRVESQLLRALAEASRRLVAAGRLRGDRRADEADVEPVVGALRDPLSAVRVELEPRVAPGEPRAAGLGKPRQLVGQPGAPGLATGPARRVRGPDDAARFRGGDVLVCDAIQPNMTHLVQLACGIVERRGGMLIHGAIIARELGIPCVNGVSRSIEDVHDGEPVTVDGGLGLVTIGLPEFRLEGVDPA